MYAPLSFVSSLLNCLFCWCKTLLLLSGDNCLLI
jgi:hypothetical protein